MRTKYCLLIHTQQTVEAGLAHSERESPWTDYNIANVVMEQYFFMLSIN